MAITSGGVSIPVGADLTGFEKGLKQAEQLANKTAAGFKKFALGKIWDTSSFVSGMKMSNKEFDKFILKTEQAKDKYRDLIQLSDGLKQSDMWSQIGDQAQKAVTDAVSMAKQEADAYDRTLKHMGRGQKVKGLFEKIKKGFSGIGSAFSSFRQKTAQAGSNFGLFMKRLVGIGSVALLVRKAFQMMQDGLANVIQVDSETANSVNQLKAAFASLKNALGAIAAPIVNAIAPALIKIINLCTRAANAIAMFLGALFRKKTILVASKQVAGLGDRFSGVGSGAKKAKKDVQALKRELLGFDKITKLTKQDENTGTTGGTGTGAGAGAGVSPNFEQVDVESWANDLAERFRKAWEEHDFYWLGESLANKLNGGLEKLNWEKIRGTLNGIAESIGTGINGFVENFDWKLLGKTLGESIKTAFDFSITFISTINWEALGKAVVDFICGIDWIGIFKKALDLQMTIAKAIGEAIKGAFKALDDNLFGGALQDLIKNMSDWWNNHKPSFEINLVDKFSGAWDKIKGAWEGLKDKKATLTTALSGLKENSLTAIGNAWKNVTSKSATLKAKLSGIKAKTMTSLSKAWSKIKGGTKNLTLNLKATVASGYNAMARKINGLLGNLPSVVRPSWRLPTLAQGGYVKANTPQLAVIGDNRREGEIVAPESKLEDMANKASGGGQTDILLRQILVALQNLDTNVYLDGESIKNNTVRRINNHTRATGQLELII